MEDQEFQVPFQNVLEELSLSLAQKEVDLASHRAALKLREEENRLLQQSIDSLSERISALETSSNGKKKEKV